MKLPIKPAHNSSNFEKLAYYRKLQEYTDWQREKNEAYYEGRIEKLNTAIAIVLVGLAVVCCVLAYLYFNK